MLNVELGEARSLALVALIGGALVGCAGVRAETLPPSKGEAAFTGGANAIGGGIGGALAILSSETGSYGRAIGFKAVSKATTMAVIRAKSERIEQFVDDADVYNEKVGIYNSRLQSEIEIIEKAGAKTKLAMARPRRMAAKNSLYQVQQTLAGRKLVESSLEAKSKLSNRRVLMRLKASISILEWKASALRASIKRLKVLEEPHSPPAI